MSALKSDVSPFPPENHPIVDFSAAREAAKHGELRQVVDVVLAVPPIIWHDGRLGDIARVGVQYATHASVQTGYARKYIVTCGGLFRDVWGECCQRVR